MDNNDYAVLTGDIMKSSVLSSAELNRALEQIRMVPGMMNAVFPEAVHTTVDIIRGDGWQILVLEPGYALRTALLLRVSMKELFTLDTRVSVGIGPVEKILNDSLARSKGLAFTRSGRGLDSMKLKKQRMVYYSSETLNRINSAESLLVEWLDVMVSPASRSQARFLGRALLKWKQKQIAEKTGVTQSSVSEGLKSIGWNEIKSVLKHFEKYRHNNR
ncbi:MAG: hypothetical protein ACMUIP_16465 [bacterium]